MQVSSPKIGFWLKFWFTTDQFEAQSFSRTIDAMDVFSYLVPLVPWIVPMGVILVVTCASFWLIRRTWPDTAHAQVSRQVALVVATVVAIIVLLLALPFDDETQGQLISLFGLVLTAVLALASTNFASNAMSGLMLKSVGSFRTGDFIRVDEHFGRVTEKFLLHTEIQTEDRDLVTLPNLYLISHPMRVVRSSGTLVSCEVTLGYDIHRRKVTEILRKAGEDAELEEPFVQITQLGDFAVGYKVSGFLADVDNMVSARTKLNAQVLDSLHEAGIEIVSPGFVNQRPAPADQPVMPNRYYGKESDDMGQAEKLMFDKAELAARVEKLRMQRETLQEEHDALKQEIADDPGDEATKASKTMELTWRGKQIEALDALLANENQDSD